jgi:phage baseplate assembly protein W
VNATLATSIAAGLAEIERLRDAPVEPLGYGVDLSCLTDLTSRMESISGTQALFEALVRRLDCPRGALVDDGDYGFDLRGAMNRGLTRANLVGISAAVRAEMEKDDRVESASVTSTISSDGTELTVVARVRPFDESAGPFALTLAVTSGAALLEATLA